MCPFHFLSSDPQSLASISAAACSSQPIPNYGLLIRYQSNYLNKKDLITAHQSWKREDFDPDDVFGEKKASFNMYARSSASFGNTWDKIVTFYQFQTTQFPNHLKWLKSLHQMKKVQIFFAIFHACSTSMVVRNLSEYFDQRVLTPKSVAPKLQIFQRGRTENALLEEKYISQQHAT